MFKNIFGKQSKEEYFEPVAPVVEKRKQERFSEPLIYNDEVKEEVKKPIVKEVKKEPVKAEPYYMSQVISPILGPSAKTEVESKKTVTKKKAKTYNSSLVTVISPFFGDEEEEDVFVEAKEEVVEVKEEVVDPFENEPTVEDNLRNYAKMIEEEQNELKIIEQRTGEFKLDFNSSSEEKVPSLIDEIEDDMSLDELMSLYEKKFND
ncbi:hypothetical protein [Tannockella kyphosi]|uniref:hypothetical protein n=1 Tax=Tannockella kyphosi TaxID=2899121 RepID=UPI002010F6D5|nr:hypothetical protein [Tannockella kyphosi]